VRMTRSPGMGAKVGAGGVATGSGARQTQAARASVNTTGRNEMRGVGTAASLHRAGL
jgi:hypothetical protein